MNTIHALFLVSTILFCSCTSTYKQADYFHTEGFVDTRLGLEMFKVTYNGGAFTDIQTAVDFCLLRCAEVTIERGHNYFRVTKDTTGISRYLVRNSDLHGSINGSPVRILGGYSQDIPRAVSSNIIVCKKSIPPSSNEFLNARKIKDYLTQKYAK